MPNEINNVRRGDKKSSLVVFNQVNVNLFFKMTGPE